MSIDIDLVKANHLKQSYTHTHTGQVKVNDKKRHTKYFIAYKHTRIHSALGTRSIRFTLIHHINNDSLCLRSPTSHTRSKMELFQHTRNKEFENHMHMLNSLTTPKNLQQQQLQRDRQQ